MGTLLLTVITLVLTAVLATFVASRAWKLSASRYFVVLSAALTLVNLAGEFRNGRVTQETAQIALSLVVLGLGLMISMLLFLFAALFMPQWWEGRQPIWKIGAPFLLITLLVGLDAFFQWGLVFTGIKFSETLNSYTLTPGGPLAIPALSLLTVGVGVEVVLLIASFKVNPASRSSIGLMLLALVVSALIGSLRVVNTVDFSNFSRFLSSTFLLAALGFVVLRHRLFETQDQAITLGIESMSDALLVASQSGKILFANKQARMLGLHTGANLEQELTTADLAHEDIARLLDHVRTGMATPLEMALTYGRPLRLLDLSATTILDGSGKPQGALVLLRDITELERRSSLLDQEQQRLTEMKLRLEHEQTQRSRLVETVRTLALPVIPVLDGVLVMPLVGTLDEQRLEEFTTVLLQEIAQQQARRVLVDLTGVELVDDRHILLIVRALRGAELLGARCTLVGIRPELAQSLVQHLDLLETVETSATLREALLPIISASQRYTPRVRA